MTWNMQTLPFVAWSGRGLWSRIRPRFEGVDDAHALRQRHLGVTDRDLADAGMTREEALGRPAFQPDLPFFMQNGFQAGRR